MTLVKVLKSGSTLAGRVKVPGDKSISHRALLFGAISKGTTTIKGILPAEDPLSTANCLRSMGVKITNIEDEEMVEVEGVGLDGLQEPEEILDCGNSGTTMRLMLGLIAGCNERHFVLTGDNSLRRRPMRRVSDPLKLMGARVQGRSNGNLAPLSVSGKHLKGAVIGTPVASAQIKSAILLAALNAKGTTSVIEPAPSRDHSERMLKAFGANIQVSGEMGRHIHVEPGSILRAQNLVVPGDISSAAFWLIAAVIVPGSEIIVENVGLNPTRTGILEIMNQMEANFEIISTKNVAGEPVGDIKVKHNGVLKAFKLDEEIMPRLIDEVPILSVAACFCEGESVINGAKELRIKETDRLAVMAKQLGQMGAKIKENPDGLIIQGKQTLKGASVNSETDHRVAMSLAIASLLAKGDTFLEGSDAASVSYPTFWDDFERLKK